MCSHSATYRCTSWGCIVGWPEHDGILLDVSNASRELFSVRKYPLTPMYPTYYSGYAAASLNLASMPHAGNRGRRGQHWFMRGARPTTCLARRYSQVCMEFTDLCAHLFVRPYLCGLGILSSVEPGMLLQQAREYASQATCTYEDLRAFKVRLCVTSSCWCSMQACSGGLAATCRGSRGPAAAATRVTCSTRRTSSLSLGKALAIHRRLCAPSENERAATVTVLRSPWRIAAMIPSLSH